MPKRRLNVTRWIGPTPAVAICTLCHREFKVPEIGLLRKSLDAAHFIAVRKIPGGPAPEALEPEIKRSEELLDTDAQWLKKLMAAFEDARTFVRTETETFLATVDTATT